MLVACNVLEQKRVCNFFKKISMPKVLEINADANFNADAGDRSVLILTAF